MTDPWDWYIYLHLKGISAKFHQVSFLDAPESQFDWVELLWLNVCSLGVSSPNNDILICAMLGDELSEKIIHMLAILYGEQFGL